MKINCKSNRSTHTIPLHLHGIAKTCSSNPNVHVLSGIDLIECFFSPTQTFYLRCHCMHNCLGTCNLRIIQYRQVTATLRLTVQTLLDTQPSQDHNDFCLNTSSSNFILFTWANFHGCGGSINLNNWKLFTDSSVRQLLSWAVIHMEVCPPPLLKRC